MSSDNGSTVKLHLDEPNQALSLIFDACLSSWDKVVVSRPNTDDNDKRRIRCEFYIQTISNLCIYLNAYLALNKHNTFHCVVMTDHGNTVIYHPTKIYTITHSDGSITADSKKINKQSNFSIDPLAISSSELYPRLYALNPFISTLIHHNSNIPITSIPPRDPTEMSSQTTAKTSNAIAASATTTNKDNNDKNIRIYNEQLLANACTRSLCWINKIKSHDTSVSTRILILSLPRLCGSIQLMNCALAAQNINCSIDTICLSHTFSTNELSTISSQPEHLQPISTIYPLLSRLRSRGGLLEDISPPIQLTPQICLCEPLQQMAHVSHGLHIPISAMDTEVSLQHLALYMYYPNQPSPILDKNVPVVSPLPSPPQGPRPALPPYPSTTSYHSPYPSAFPLLGHLLTHCLAASSLRSHLLTPQFLSVSLSAPCSCHHTPCTTAFICSKCLAMTCQQRARCPSCGERYALNRKSVAPMKRSLAPSGGTSGPQPIPLPTTNQSTSVSTMGSIPVVPPLGQAGKPPQRVAINIKKF